MRTMSMQENVLGKALAFARRVTSAQIDTASCSVEFGMYSCTSIRAQAMPKSVIRMVVDEQWVPHRTLAR